MESVDPRCGKVRGTLGSPACSRTFAPASFIKGLVSAQIQECGSAPAETKQLGGGSHFCCVDKKRSHCETTSKQSRAKCNGARIDLEKSIDLNQYFYLNQYKFGKLSGLRCASPGIASP